MAVTLREIRLHDEHRDALRTAAKMTSIEERRSSSLLRRAVRDPFTHGGEVICGRAIVHATERHLRNAARAPPLLREQERALVGSAGHDQRLIAAARHDISLERGVKRGIRD